MIIVISVDFTLEVPDDHDLEEAGLGEYLTEWPGVIVAEQDADGKPISLLSYETTHIERVTQ